MKKISLLGYLFLTALLLTAAFGVFSPVSADTATPSDSTPSGSTPATTDESATKTIPLQNPLGGTPENPLGVTSVPRLIGNVIKTVLAIVGALALAMFIYGGFTWLTSGGSAEKIKKGKDILMWAVIGLVVIFASYSLVDFLLTAFGVAP